jgi:hypothetical protein
MDVERIIYLGYEIELIYQPFFDDSTPKSKQYKLIIKKQGRELINRYGFTRSGAITFYKRWIADNSCK